MLIDMFAGAGVVRSPHGFVVCTRCIGKDHLQAHRRADSGLAVNLQLCGVIGEEALETGPAPTELMATTVKV
jgi:hypothetical protein